MAKTLSIFGSSSASSGTSIAQNITALTSGKNYQKLNSAQELGRQFTESLTLQAHTPQAVDRLQVGKTAFLPLMGGRRGVGRYSNGETVSPLKTTSEIAVVFRGATVARLPIVNRLSPCLNPTSYWNRLC